MTAHLSRLFRYDAWANRETLASLEAAAAPPASAVKGMAHVLGAESLWLARVTDAKSPLAVWPGLSLADCAREAGRLEAAWSALLGDLSDDGLARRVAYVNSKGEPWESAVGDILQHVVMHSVYHRGQIAYDLRAAGFEPASTDFIHAVRQGRVG